MKLYKYLILSTLSFFAAASCSGSGSEVVNVDVSVSPSELEAPHTLSNQEFEVQSDGSWTITVLAEDGRELSWAKPSKTRGTGNAQVSVRIYQNEYKDARVAKITVTSVSGNVAVVTLTQDGNPDSAQESSEITARIGTFNLRVIKTEEDPQNNWANRKTRVIKSIKENDFDIFGVNECSTDIQTYLKEQLNDTYECVFFSPYSQNGSGNKAQGIVYKKDYTLSDWHFFWLSADPDHMSYNDTSGGSSYSRGGCCAVLTHKGTGIKMFMMVTHGALNDTTRDTYAYVYEDMEKRYNPKGYPSFFVGDMNASPSAPATKTYLTYWKDARLELPAADISGPVATYNGFDLSASLTKASSRIDYVYYRNATPLKYVCNDARYEGYYPSDHLPVYSDMKVQATAE